MRTLYDEIGFINEYATESMIKAGVSSFEIFEKAGAFSRFSSVAGSWMGMANNLFTIYDFANILADNQGDVIQEIIAKEFHSQMYALTKDELKIKYYFAYASIQKLLDEGSLGYQTNKAGDFSKYTQYNQEDIDKIIDRLNKF